MKKTTPISPGPTLRELLAELQELTLAIVENRGLRNFD